MYSAVPMFVHLEPDLHSDQTKNQRRTDPSVDRTFSRFRDRFLETKPSIIEGFVMIRHVRPVVSYSIKRRYRLVSRLTDSLGVTNNSGFGKSI